MDAELLRGLLDRQEAAGCPLARELRVLRQMCSCLNDDHSVDEAEQRYAEMVSQLSVAQGQGCVMVPRGNIEALIRELESPVGCYTGAIAKKLRYLLAAAPAQPDGVDDK